MTTLQSIAATVTPEVQMNENFETMSAAGIFGKRQPVTTALVWGYYGGIYNGNTVADGTVALTNASDNYVVALRSTGAVSVSAANTNWNSALYARLYKITCAGGVVTVVEDHRQDTNGLLLAAPSVGRFAIWVPASEMRPSAAGGCAALAVIASAANQPDIISLDFDGAAQEYAQFSREMPKRWDEGTVTFVPVWSHAATAVNFGVVFDLQGVAVSDLDSIAQAYGASQTSVDVGGTTNTLYKGPESAAITIANAPAAEDVVFFRISRVVANAGDTMAIDARLHGVILFITTDAPTDA